MMWNALTGLPAEEREDSGDRSEPSLPMFFHKGPFPNIINYSSIHNNDEFCKIKSFITALIWPLFNMFSLL